MNHAPDSNATPNDKDIAELFKQQQVRIPEGLDDTILKASREALKDNDASQQRLIPQAPWMAVAATVVLAVLVAPLMLTSPDTQLEVDVMEIQSEAQTPSALERPTLTPTPTDEPANATPPAPELTLKLAPMLAPNENASTASDSAKRQSDSAMKRPMTSSASTGAPVNTNSTTSSLSSDSPRYRSTPKSWLNQIERLIMLEQLTEAQEEYDLFVEQYPDHLTDIKIPEQ